MPPASGATTQFASPTTKEVIPEDAGVAILVGLRGVMNPVSEVFLALAQ